MQITWAENLARRLFGLEGCLKEIKKLKFMRPIAPESTVVLRLASDSKGTAFSYEDARGTPLAKGLLVFAGV